MSVARAHISSSTLSCHGIDQLVVPHYDELDAHAECALFKRGLNDTYMLRAGKQRFALKVYRLQWRSHKAITEELACVEHLAAKDVPVATPVRRRDGELITQLPTPEGRRSAVMFRWIDGALPDYAAATHSTGVGRHLAALHAASDGLRLGRERPPMDVSSLFERPCAAIRTRVERVPRLRARLDAVAAQVASRLQHAHEELDDWGPCHGDYIAYNLRIADGRVWSFDYDWCGPGWRLYDVASYVWAARYLGRVREFSAQALLDAYSKVRPRAAGRDADLGLFVVLRHFWYAAQCIALAPYVGASILRDGFFDEFVEFCEAALVADTREHGTSRLSTGLAHLVD
jgi:Ser/Thr protein kinase RdoA (MazF antagonist)